MVAQNQVCHSIGEGTVPFLSNPRACLLHVWLRHAYIHQLYLDSNSGDYIEKETIVFNIQ
jgi:hypothetical protein